MAEINKAIIVGAGIGGLTAALALAKCGVQVLVLEQADDFGEVGAGLQMSPNAMKVLRELGVEEALKPHAFIPQHAAMRNYQSGEYYLKMPLADQAEARYGAPYWHLHRADLHQVLLNACKDVGVELHLKAKISQYQEEQGRVIAMLEDGRTYVGDVLIGADGIHSKVQEQMLGTETPYFTGQVAWRGVIPVKNLSVDVKPDACVWVGPNRHFVTYRLRGGGCVNFVAVEERSDWRSESWRDKGDVEELKKVFAGWHPEVTGLLDSVADTFIWALHGRHVLPTWHKGSVVLLGDACHPMLPFMAQGAAMAIEDAYVLADKLINESNVVAAFSQYEAIRKPRATKIQQMSQANAGLYHMHGGVLGHLKLKALQGASRLAPKVLHSKLDGVYGFDVTSS